MIVPGGDESLMVYAYIKGYTDHTFRAENDIARCEVAAIFARISPDYDPSIHYPVSFPDVPMDAWYRNELGYCVQAGIITGRPDGNFAPMESIDRGELAAMAARFLELANSGSTSAFADVPASYWAHGYIAQLTEKGIVNGNGQGLYLPTEAISRAETV